MSFIGVMVSIRDGLIILVCLVVSTALVQVYLNLRWHSSQYAIPLTYVLALSTRLFSHVVAAPVSQGSDQLIKPKKGVKNIVIIYFILKLLLNPESKDVQ